MSHIKMEKRGLRHNHDLKNELGKNHEHTKKSKNEDLLVKSMEKLVLANEEQKERTKKIEMRLNESYALIAKLEEQVAILTSKLELVRLYAEADQDLHHYMVANRIQIGNDIPLTRTEIDSLSEKYAR